MSRNDLWILSDGTVLPNDVRKCKGSEYLTDNCSGFVTEHSMASVYDAYNEYKNTTEY